MRARIVEESGASRVERVSWRRLGTRAAGSPPEEGAANEDGAGQEGDAQPETTPRPDPASVIAELEARIQTIAIEAGEDAAARERHAAEHGYQAGFRDGEASGQKTAATRFSAEAAAILEQVTQGVAQMLAFRVRVRQQMEADLVRLSIAIARRIVYRELHVDPEALLGIVKAAVDKVDSRELLRLRVSAADYALLERPLREMLAPLRADLISDATLSRGGVVLETGRGELDASVETQLVEIDRGLTDVTGRSR